MGNVMDSYRSEQDILLSRSVSVLVFVVLLEYEYRLCMDTMVDSYRSRPDILLSPFL